MRFLTTVAAILWCLCASAQRQQYVGIAYWNVDKLYDTIPARFYDDTAYTPRGAMRWGTERYTRKIRNTVQVIDSMALPVVALFGVENETVVRDIVGASAEDYSYIHRTRNSLDGMDFALLYFGDMLLVERVDDGRDYLRIEGCLDGKEVAIIVCCNPRILPELANEIRHASPERHIIALGRVNMVNFNAFGLRNAMQSAESAGQGNMLYSKGWRMSDKILTDTRYTSSEGRIFARKWMTDSRTGAPIATFDKGRYTGGYSRALPIIIYIR